MKNRFLQDSSSDIDFLDEGEVKDQEKRAIRRYLSQLSKFNQFIMDHVNATTPLDASKDPDYSKRVITKSDDIVDHDEALTFAAIAEEQQSPEVEE